MAGVLQSRRDEAEAEVDQIMRAHGGPFVFKTDARTCLICRHMVSLNRCCRDWRKCATWSTLQVVHQATSWSSSPESSHCLCATTLDEERAFLFLGCCFIFLCLILRNLASPPTTTQLVTELTSYLIRSPGN